MYVYMYMYIYFKRELMERVRRDGKRLISIQPGGTDIRTYRYI